MIPSTRPPFVTRPPSTRVVAAWNASTSGPSVLSPSIPIPLSCSPGYPADAMTTHTAAPSRPRRSRDREATARGSQHSVQEVGAKHREEDLGLRIAQSSVELEDLRVRST